MITNNAPAKMVLQNIVAAYRKVYVQHSIYSDLDVLGRSFWVTEGSNSVREQFTGLNTFFAVISNLKTSTPYSVQGAFYDQIVDLELLEAKIGINLSDIRTFTTSTPPTITSTQLISEPVDVGVGTPVLIVTAAGDASYAFIEAKLVDSTEWTIVYTGSIAGDISLGLPTGSYNLRITGFINLPDGATVDSSGATEYPSVVEVNYNFNPPSVPTDIVFKAARIADGKERFDLRIEWEWEKGAGSNVREFIVSYVDSDAFADSGWTKANKINVGAAQAATVTSFAWNKEFTFKVSSVAWGPGSQSIVDSSPVTFILNEDTILDNSFVNETGIEVNYAYIKGSVKSGTTWNQTFLIDAGTGAINIGLLDEDGKAPISFDPLSRTVNIDGKVITKSIYAANFILTNLDGEDNPAIYSQGKYYGSDTKGIWMGIDKTDQKYKLDIGDNLRYIRWTGDEMIISGGVTIGTAEGDISLEDGLVGRFQVYAYYKSPTRPDKPTDVAYPPEGWFANPPLRLEGEVIWAIVGTINPMTNKLQPGTSWSDVTQWSGDDGTIGVDGARGPGFYAQGIAGLTSFNASEATNFFTANLGSSPKDFDVITQYDSNNPKTAFTRQWKNGAWTTAALTVHGDMILTGTVTADKLVADVAFLQKAGINVIYDTAAALSTNPEAVYTMKISLEGGYIHIR